MRGTDPTCENASIGKKLIRGPIRLIQFVYFSSLQRFKVLPKNSKQIFFTLDDDKLYRSDDGMGRYAYMTLNAFSEAGYNVYLYKKINLLGFIKLGFYGRFIYYIKNLKFVSKIPTSSEGMIYAFDTIYANLLQRKWKKLVYVNILKPSSCSVGETVWIPYYFHPQIYRLRQHFKIKSLRNQKRVLKIFFGGNASEVYYTNSNLFRNYRQMTRKVGISTLLELKNRVKRVNHFNSFLKILKTKQYIDQCWILETNRCGNTKLTQWFETIASSDFFMCFSGTDLPMCHNSIESMAVGTIPILSYPHWFFPSLEHKKNAIIYSGKEDLKIKIQEVLSMKKEEIEQMRLHAIDYYDRYLSNSSFIYNFERNQDNICTIMLHPRLVSTLKEEKQGEEFVKDLEKVIGKTAKPIISSAADFSTVSSYHIHS